MEDCEPDSRDKSDAQLLAEDCDRELQAAAEEIRLLRGRTSQLLNELRDERAKGEHNHTELRRLQSSRFFYLAHIIRPITRRLGVGRILTIAGKLVRKLRPFGRQLAFSLLPTSYHPLIIIRAAARVGRQEVMTLLPFDGWPQKLRAVGSSENALRYTFLSAVESLSEVVLFLNSERARHNHLINISIFQDGELKRQISETILPGQSIAPTALVFDSLSGVLSKEISIVVSDQSSSLDDFVALKEFGTLRWKPRPWIVTSEVDLTRCADTSPAVFTPCFRAEKQSHDSVAVVDGMPGELVRQYVQLVGEREVSFSFLAPEEPLTSLSVIWGTGCRVNKVRVRLIVQAPGFAWEGNIDGSLLIDNLLAPLPIPKEVFDNIAGRLTTVRLSSPEAGALNQLAILGAHRPCSDLVGDVEPRLIEQPKKLSEIAGVPRLRSVFLPGARTARQLRVNVILPINGASLEERRVGRALVAAVRAAGFDGELYQNADVLAEEAGVSRADIVVIFEQPYTEELRRVVTEVRGSYGIAVACHADGCSGSGPRSVPGHNPPGRQLLEACPFTLKIADDSEAQCFDKTAAGDVLPGSLRPDAVKEWLTRLIPRHRERNLPRVSVVTVLYRKEREVPFFLQSLSEQDYEGELELIVVDDCSPDQSKATLFKAYQDLSDRGARLPSLSIIDNPENAGNCRSRNRAVAQATGDIVVIVDCDCVLNRSFVSAHVYSHRLHDADVVVGPCNLETGHKDPLVALAEFDADRGRILREAELQDAVNLDSFVNCITRNFSIQKRHVAEPLFDELFSYSAHPDSGFGWEDVEMGYRLYLRGLRIHFTENAFSVHVSHIATTDNRNQSLKSLKNFRRLLEKHPTIFNDNRRWFADTFRKIEGWLDHCGQGVTEDREFIRRELGQMYPYPFAIRKDRKLRILTYRWHVPHQYELYKLPHEFTLLGNLPTGFTRSWDGEQRPQPRNAVFRPLHDVCLKDYDLAILHFDENVLRPEYCNQRISIDWGANFLWMLLNTPNLPKVAVCHGTPQFFGQYQPTYQGPDLGTIIDSSRSELVETLGNIPVVCNSYQAQKEWGFHRSRVIWHGFDPSEFEPTDYRGGVLSLGQAMRERPHYRGYELFKEVQRLLPLEAQPQTLSVPKPPIFGSDSEIYARLKYQSYRASIRQHSVYFNPTLRSPMPRSRGEAMMSGVVPVSAANHDVQLFIKNGHNGFYSDSPEELADFISFLMRDRGALKQIGAQSRRTAADVFNHDRYLSAWQSLISEVIGL